MKIIEKRRPVADFPGSLPYIKDNMLFVDIETTGFQSQNQQIYMIGTACLDGDSIYVRLLFATVPREESEILQEFMHIIKDYNTVISFNGDRFDIPFILQRLKVHNIPYEYLQTVSSIDIHKKIRPYKKLLGLISCKQKDIETLCQITRTDEMDGGKLISVYDRYTKNPTESDEKLLICHNEDDVWGMVSIIPVLSYSLINNTDLTLDSIEWNNEESILIARISMGVTIPKAFRIHEDAFYMIVEEDRLNAAFFISSEPMHYYYPYPAQYVYLIRENSVVPKLLASSVPSSQKRPARSDECFSTVTGNFVAIDSKIIKKQPSWLKDKHILQKTYKDSLNYIKTDPQSLDENLIISYTGLLLDQYLPVTAP